MFLPFSTDRRLSRIAADAAQIEDRAESSAQPWRRSGHRQVVYALRSGPSPGEPASANDLVARRDLERAIEVAVVGDAADLEALLTADAVNTSPTHVFASRAKAVEARRDHTAALAVTKFEVIRLLWTDALVVAEWRLEATQASPLLVGDDVLIEGSDRPIALSGATVAERSDDRFFAVRTYFDEAALIEQVLLRN